jgi:hypothetical protein
MNHEQWVNAIKSKKKVKFTNDFMSVLIQNDLTDGLPIEQRMVMYHGGTTHELHTGMITLVDTLSNKPTLTNSELSVLQSLLWDEKKFSIIEEVIPVEESSIFGKGEA